jgi:hypothetical protein
MGTPEPGEPTAPPHLPRAGVNQDMSWGDAAREQPSGHTEDPPRPVPPSNAAAGGNTAPRIVVHIRSAAQPKAAQSVTAPFTAQGYVLPKAATLVERGPLQSRVRSFHHADAREATHLAALLTQVHRQPVVSHFIPGYEDSPLLLPRHDEVWLASDPRSPIASISSITDHRSPLSPPPYDPPRQITCSGVMEAALARPDRSVATGSARTGGQLPMVIQAASAGPSDPAVELARRLRLALKSCDPERRSSIWWRS